MSCPAKARFFVRETFRLSSRHLFVLLGSIVQGSIRAGMSIRIALNSSVSLQFKIHSIEFARREGGAEDVCLCVKCEEGDFALLEGLNIGDETVEVE